MCEKCAGIDVKIARYRRVLDNVNDESVIAIVEGFIVDLEAEKVDLHPDSAQIVSRSVI